MDTRQMEKIVRDVILRMQEERGEGNGSEVAVLTERARAAQAIWHGDFNIAAKTAVITKLRQDLRPHVEELAKMACEETGMGRFEDKVLKKRVAIEKTPGPEFFTTHAVSGDNGLVLEELAPFGVIASICPSTNPVASVINNTICMIAGGNAVVFAPHPGAAKCTHRTVEIVMKSLRESGAPDGLISSLQHVSLDAMNELMTSPNVNLISATGGPGVVRAALQSGKPAIGAGPGNPPVVVDETADVEQAAIDIITGASFDNNLQCIAEKEVIAVNCIADDLRAAMLRNGAFELKDPAKVDELLKMTLEKGKPSRKWVGRPASLLLEQLGYKVEPKTRIILVETGEDHPFAQEEMLMPILPLIRAADFEEALAMAKRLEHGFRHSACIHSSNVNHMSRMAREMQTTVFVKNAPTLAAIGVGGDCPTAFTIATATGEGPTTPASFCRTRRCVLHGAFRII